MGRYEELQAWVDSTRKPVPIRLKDYPGAEEKAAREIARAIERNEGLAPGTIPLYEGRGGEGPLGRRRPYFIGVMGQMVVHVALKRPVETFVFRNKLTAKDDEVLGYEVTTTELSYGRMLIRPTDSMRSSRVLVTGKWEGPHLIQGMLRGEDAFRFCRLFPQAVKMPENGRDPCRGIPQRYLRQFNADVLGQWKTEQLPGERTTRNLDPDDDPWPRPYGERWPENGGIDV